jgi:hypothetical protein
VVVVPDGVVPDGGVVGVVGVVVGRVVVVGVVVVVVVVVGVVEVVVASQSPL